MKKIKKRELLKYDYTNNIKVLFDDNFKFFSVNHFKSLSSSYYQKYIYNYDCTIFDISSFISSLSDKSFLHSISMLEVLFLLCKYFDVSFSFNYNFFSFPAPLNTISSYDSFYDFIFCTFTDFKTKSNFYKFVRSLYRDFYSLKSCVSIVCVNSKSIIIYFKDCTTSIIDIKDCFSSSFF